MDKQLKKTLEKINVHDDSRSNKDDRVSPKKAEHITQNISSDTISAAKAYVGAKSLLVKQRGNFQSPWIVLEKTLSLLNAKKANGSTNNESLQKYLKLTEGIIEKNKDDSMYNDPKIKNFMNAFSEANALFKEDNNTIITEASTKDSHRPKRLKLDRDHTSGTEKEDDRILDAMADFIINSHEAQVLPENKKFEYARQHFHHSEQFKMLTQEEQELFYREIYDDKISKSQTHLLIDSINNITEVSPIDKKYDNQIKEMPIDIVQKLANLRAKTIQRHNQSLNDKEKYQSIMLNIDEILLGCTNSSKKTKRSINNKRKDSNTTSSGISSITEAFYNLDRLKNDVGGSTYIETVNTIKDYLKIPKY
jgi:hypothetical protein